MIAMAPTIDDLSGDFPDASNGARWQMLSDAVMGGVSAGQMTRTVIAERPAIRMQGTVSLENNGGFLQIALDLAPGGAGFDASGFGGIAVDVWGNGEDYGLHLRTANLSRPWQSYRMSFAAMPNWQEIRLPFRDFAPHRTDLPFDARLLRRIGIVAIGRAFTADVAVGGLRFFPAEA